MIDVNSGSFIGRGKGAALEDTITKTNLEAAEEVVNQLRLRDIGGIIVIDFIDMARARNRDAVMKTLRKTLDEDRTKTFTAEISKLGLVEMTRQNVTEGVREIMSRPCPTCDGEGVIRSEETYRDRVRAPPARHRRRKPRRGGVPRADQPARDRRVHRARLARAACAGGARRASRSCSRAPKGSRWSTSRSPSRAPARRSRSARCRSARATRCWSRSSSRTCTTSTTRSAKIDGYIISIAGAAPLRRREADGAHRPGRAHRGERAAAGRVRRGGPPDPQRRPAGARRRRRAGGTAEAQRGRRRRAEPVAAEPRRTACRRRPAQNGSRTPEDARRRRRSRAGGRRHRRGATDGAARMTYNPSLGVVAAGAGDAVRLPRRKSSTD